MTDFQQTLQADKQAIDADIAAYVKHLKATTAAEYPEGSQLAVHAYCDILTRGGKRLRGALVLEGYKMCGGSNEKMILQAARAIEMIHASLLIIDDVQDRSELRRGGPTAHIKLAKKLKDDHLAETLAINGALLGNYGAMTILANLDAPAELRSNVLSILNRTLVITGHGQIADPMNQLRDNVTEADVTKVQEWKSATYSILNPLHVGMVLAGADCQATDGVTAYAHAVGQAFQITDDIIGSFGDSQDTGKNSMDDIREGKRTLLTVYALQHAKPTDKTFLLTCLGNSGLTHKEFAKCQQILRQTGALEYAQECTKSYIKAAIKSLPEDPKHWSKAGNDFLQQLANYLLSRQS